jgi:hypothetical protein
MLEKARRAHVVWSRPGIAPVIWCVLFAVTVMLAQAGAPHRPAASGEPRTCPGRAAYCRDMPDDHLPSRRRVFISFTYDAAPAAGEIERTLRGDGMDVWNDQVELPLGESWLRHLDHALARVGAFIVVLAGSRPDAAGAGQWNAAARAVQRRGIDVIPVVHPASGIDELAGWPVVEYSGPDASQVVADRVRFGAAIDLAAMRGPALEALVSDLLQQTGWTIASSATRPDDGYDLRITQEPGPDVNWPAETLVQVKAYRDRRVSVNTISQLASVVQTHHGTAGLLVTNGQLTTVARSYANEASQAGTPMQVIDGPELRQMLVAHPDVVLRHIPAAGPGAEQ